MEELKQEFRLGDVGDPWGNCMAWLFAIADVLHFEHDGAPMAWQFRPSPFGPDYGAPEYETAVKCSKEDLTAFGNLLNRYSDLLRRQGRDY